MSGTEAESSTKVTVDTGCNNRTGCNSLVMALSDKNIGGPRNEWRTYFQELHAQITELRNSEYQQDKVKSFFDNFEMQIGAIDRALGRSDRRLTPKLKLKVK